MMRMERVPGTPRIALDVTGTGPFVLFLHGIGGNRSNWRAQSTAFSEHFTFAAMDARGYGDSDDYSDALAFDDFVLDVVRVLDHYHVDRAHLVGLSMGGRVAMRTALLHPDRVATLTLVDTHEGFEAFSAQQRRDFVESRRAPLLSGKEPRDIAEPVARSLAGPKATPAHLEQLIESIASLHKASYIKSLEATVAQINLGDISRIRSPAHFIVGADDPLTPPRMHFEMAAKLCNAPVSVVPDAGHLSNIENPESFNQAALAWLLPRSDAATTPTIERGSGDGDE